VTTVNDREGVARLTRVAKPTDSTGGLMPPLRPPPQAPPPGAADNLTKREANPPAGAELLPQTGVARLTPKAPAVEQAAREFRQVMGRFATGVTVVTTVERDIVHGMTANGFLSVSLRPPLVLVSLGRCRMNEMLPRSARYGVSVLSHDQQHFAAHFAAQKRSPIEPTFEWRNGLPLLEGALAHLVCRVADVHRAGDHVLWIGEVEYLAHQGDEPLLFYSGRFGTMREISDRAERGK
jgi:flavin reductase (DIM6/NTAB) family NADH-FMN oxidoreductase RutF